MNSHIQQLDKHNLRKTPSRVELLHIFSEELKPLDALELRSRLKKRGISVDQATIYRMLDSFLSHEIITRFEFQEGKFRYELAGEEHHHLICTNCGKIEDISDCNLSGLEHEIRVKKGFLVKKHALEFFWNMYHVPAIVNILFFTFLASIVSLFLVSVLLLKEKLMHRLSFSLVSFAAGALLSTAFLDTLKEALEMDKHFPVLLWVMVSIAGFFIIERLFLSMHHHEEEGKGKDQMRLPIPLLLFGDGLHNFIDGASIAASFLVSPSLGIVTSLTVFVHEIPHELGDFGILLHKGWSRSKVLWFNVITSLTSIIGALLGYYLGNTFADMVPFLLAITTGNFIYLSMTDLLPEIHHSAKGQAIKHIIYFILGVLFVSLLITFLG